MTVSTFQRPSKRHPDILRLVREQGSYRVSDLAEEFGVTLETIRRDIAPLADSGQLIKLHGYVSMPQDAALPPFQARMQENPETKARIARALAKLIEDDASVMIEAGSTINHIAKSLAVKSGLTVITNSLEVARILSAAPDSRVYIAGGEVRLDEGASLGRSAVDYIRQFTAQYGIISANAIDVRRGITRFEPLDAEFCGALLDQCATKILAIDASKFEREALVQICEFSGIDILVTDARPADELRSALENAGVRIVLAD